MKPILVISPRPRTRLIKIDNSALQQATIGTNIVSAVVAVIVLHLALGLFIYKVRCPEQQHINIRTTVCSTNILQAYFSGSSRKDIKSD